MNKHNSCGSDSHELYLQLIVGPKIYIHNPPGKFAAKCGPIALIGFIAPPVIAPNTITSTKTSNPQEAAKKVKESFSTYATLIITAASNADNMNSVKNDNK